MAEARRQAAAGDGSVWCMCSVCVCVCQGRCQAAPCPPVPALSPSASPAPPPARTAVAQGAGGPHVGRARALLRRRGCAWRCKMGRQGAEGSGDGQWLGNTGKAAVARVTALVPADASRPAALRGALQPAAPCPLC